MALVLDGTNGVSGVDGTASNPSLEGTDSNTGVFFPAADTWAVATGGTEALRVDSARNMGLGVTPSGWSNMVPALELGPYGSAIAAWTNNRNMYLLSNAYYNGSQFIYKTTGGAVYYQVSGESREHRWFTAGSGTAGNAISFTQAMTLNASGALIVTPSAVTSALTGQGVSGDVAQQMLSLIKFDNNSTTSQVFAKFFINNGASACGQINANGANTAAFGSTSDQRVKENIEDLPSQLQNILALRPVEFDYIESYGGGHQIGFIAQEMQEVYPDVVSADDSEERILSITGWSKTEARLVKAIQELNAKVEAQAAEIAALKGAA